MFTGWIDIRSMGVTDLFIYLSSTVTVGGIGELRNITMKTISVKKENSMANSDLNKIKFVTILFVL